MKRGKKILIAILVILVVLVGAAAGGVYYVVHDLYASSNYIGNDLARTEQGMENRQGESEAEEADEPAADTQKIESEPESETKKAETESESEETGLESEAEAESETDMKENGVEPESETDTKETGIEAESETDMKETETEAESESDTKETESEPESETETKETETEPESESEVKETDTESEPNSELAESESASEEPDTETETESETETDPFDPAAEETIAPEDAEGRIITQEEEAQIIEELEKFASEEPVTTDGDVYNVLLIGVDRRDDTWAGNSDTMILFSINAKKKQVSMISLMRDTYVNIPGIGMRKLNAAHANGAGPLLLETVQENFKIEVDRYIRVDFNSMIEIIDMLGGIEIEMSDAEVKVANGYISEMCRLRGEDEAEHQIPAGGVIECDGMRAVAYARIRYVGNSDYQRTERQRLVLTELINKLKKKNIFELYGLVKKLLPMVTHNIPESEVWGLLTQAAGILDYKIVQDRIPYDNMYEVIYVNGQDMLVPDWSATVEKLKETLY